MEKHTSIKPCRGGTFFVVSPHGGVEERVGGMGGLMNKYSLEVCDNSRLEMLLSTSHIALFDYRFRNQTKSLLTSNDPTGVFLITQGKWDQTEARKTC